MAPLPVIGNVARIALIWNTVNGIKPVNVLHLITDSTDEEQIANDLHDAWADAGGAQFNQVANGFAIDAMAVTLLDGTSATQVINVTPDIGGAGGGEAIPQAAAVLSMHTSQRGPRGRGRLYIGPLGEAVQSNGLLNGGAKTTALAAWNDSVAPLAASPSTASYAVASYVHADVHGVSSFSMRNPTGTQRRRQNQLV